MMTQFLHTLLNMSLTAAFVAAVVFLLRLVLKGRVARQMVCLLWLIVFARLLIPVTLQSPVSLVPDMEMNDPAPVVSTAPDAVPTQPVNTSPIQGGMTVAPPVMTNPVQTPVVTIPPNVSAPDPVVSAPAEEIPPVTEEPAPFPWGTVLTVVWAAGVAAMLIYGMGSYLSIRRMLRFAIRTKEGWWEDPNLRSPFILGLVRPKIYLPCHMTPYTRQFILCHEKAHIRRGDHIIKPICWLALAIHWFNPLAWVAFLLLSRDIEVACDEKVLRELGQEVKADYSATLLALATNGRFPAPTPLAFGEGDAKSRIKSVLSFRKPALWVTVAAVVVAIVAAVCLLTDPVDKFDPDDYTTQDCYLGLYFERTVVEETGETTVKAYALEDDKPVLVAGWSDHPADNLATLIHPDGENEVILATRWEITARYEQYLVDYMMEQDESWAQRYIEEADDLVTFLQAEVYPYSSQSDEAQDAHPSDFMGGIAYTPEENLLFCWEGTAQVLPRWTPYSPNAHTVKVYAYDRTEDGTDRLDILWTGKDVTLAVSSTPGGLQTYTGDALITYLWDGEMWTAHSSANTIAFTDKPVSFDAANQRITVTYDPNAYTNGNPDIAQIDPGMIRRQFSIPAELGRVQTIAVGELAGIARREDGDYDLTYSVLAMPEGKSADTDWVHILDLTAILKWNTLTEEFGITFTGAEEAGGTADDQPGQTYVTIPADAELLYDGGVASLYGLPNDTVILQYGDYIQAVPEFGYNASRPGCTMWETDGNGDGVKELHIIHQFGSGTGVSIDKLTTVIPTDRGLEVSCHNWSSLETLFEQSNLFTYYPEDNSISVTYGGGQNLRIRLSSDYAGLDWDACGDSLIIATIANYSLNEDGIVTLSFAPALSDGSAIVHYLPMRVEYPLVLKKELTGRLCWSGGDASLVSDDPGMVVQPYTVTPLENSPENPYYTDFELTCNGKSIQFSGQHLKIAPIGEGDDILTYYFDMTGDGVPDPVVMLVRAYGSGPVKRDIHVFDGVTLEEYDMSGLLSVAEDAFTFTGDEDNFFITGENLSVTIPRAAVNSYHSQFAQSVFPFTLLDSMEVIDDSFSVTEKDGMLCVNLACLVYQHRVMGQLRYGSVNAYMMLVDGKLTPVKLTFADPNGVEFSQSLTAIASLPEEDVYLYMDQNGSFMMQAYGHYGPLSDLNALTNGADPSSLDNLSKLTSLNLSGPDYEYIAFTINVSSSTTPAYYEWIWNDDQKSWVLFGDTDPLNTLPRDIVTGETYPEDPEWYYKVAETELFNLYARHGGQEVMLTYGNFFWDFDHAAHTGHMNLPILMELNKETAAVISEVNTGPGVGVDELVVYRILFDQAVESSHYTLAQDYLYDWRALAADFNRNNTLTYDKETNSLTLSWNGSTYSSGRLAEDLSVSLELEDGFTGALIATGDIIRIAPHTDGTFTVRMKTSIAEGSNGSFSGWFWQRADEDSYVYPSSIGVTGLDLVWTVQFTGEGFEIVSAPAIATNADVSLVTFRELLIPDFGNWYNGALASVFDRPEEMDLSLVFYNKFPDGEEWQDFTADEESWLIQQGFPRHISVQKRPAEQLDQALQQYFGVSLYDVEIPEEWVYYPETDSYYSSHSDDGSVWPFTVTKVDSSVSGYVFVFYEPDELWATNLGSTQMVLTLRESGDHFTVMSNQTQAEWQTAKVPPTPTADMFGLDALHSVLFDAARAGYFSDHTSEQESPRAVLPIVTVLDRYEQDGKLHVICRAGYHMWYYDGGKNQLENTPGSEITYIRAVLTVNDNSSYILEDVIYPSVNTGYSAGIQEVFKDRPDTYAKYQANTLEALSSFPEWDEMLRLYLAATGLTLKD